MRMLAPSLCAVVALSAGSTLGSVHFWHITEVYSNADGSVQYVELHTDSENQQFFKTLGNNTRLILKTPDGTSTLDTYFFPSDSPSPTTNHHILVGTSNLGSLGVTPDFVLPAQFLETSGGQLDLVSDIFGTFISSVYPALPGGNQAYHPELSQTALSSATNYAGTTVAVPEPAALGMISLMTTTLLCRRRRRD